MKRSERDADLEAEARQQAVNRAYAIATRVRGRSLADIKGMLPELWEHTIKRSFRPQDLSAFLEVLEGERSPSRSASPRSCCLL
jgi:hypothetical protein